MLNFPDEVIYKMKKTLISLRTALAVTLCVALVASVLRSVAFVTAFDRSIGYFDRGAVPTLLYIVIALAVAGVAAFAFLHRRNVKELPCPTRDERSLLLSVVAGVVSTVLAFAAVLDVLTFAGGASVLVLARGLAAALAIPYFLLPANRRVLPFGLAAHLYCLLVLITEYFDRYVTMNSPVKVMQQFALVAFMLYLASEMYAALGTVRPLRTTAFGLLSVFFSITSGISCIVAGIAGGILTRDYLIGAIGSLALGLYTAACLNAATLHPHPDETENT